jgi:hypothetical protein
VGSRSDFPSYVRMQKHEDIPPLPFVAAHISYHRRPHSFYPLSNHITDPQSPKVESHKSSTSPQPSLRTPVLPHIHPLPFCVFYSLVLQHPIVHACVFGLDFERCFGRQGVDYEVVVAGGAVFVSGGTLVDSGEWRGVESLGVRRGGCDGERFGAEKEYLRFLKLFNVFPECFFAFFADECLARITC